MSTENITDLLRAPLDPDWTVERLADRVLDAVAAGPDQEFVLTTDDTADRQSRRLLRPLLAHLAARSADEAGASPDLYGGRLAVRRFGPTGPVWVVGHFENRPGRVRATLRCSRSPAGPVASGGTHPSHAPADGADRFGAPAPL